MCGKIHNYPKFLWEAAKHCDPDWIYFHCWGADERREMDTWLVCVGHHLAFEPGTNEYRFKHLMKEIHASACLREDYNETTP